MASDADSPLQLPVIDIAPLFPDPITGSPPDPEARSNVAAQIAVAAERDGFFYITGHRVRPETIADLDAAGHAFFALDEATKATISMANGGAAWRGSFPVGGELTGGRPDLKEGIYFGEEHDDADPRVRAGWPLHGRNQWPAEPASLRPAVERYMAEARETAAVLMEGVSVALGLDSDYFARAYLRRPTVLFRIFHYPPPPTTVTSTASATGNTTNGNGDEDPSITWGVGEHTDYGLLTMLAQDSCGGLEVRTDRGWISAPPIPGTLICNVGDMLERLTGGRFVSAPHRVRNLSGRDRLSFPLFYDPDFSALMTPAVNPVGIGHRNRYRWDNADPKQFAGTYGDYLLLKVGRVFPDLKMAAGFLTADD